ncbi:hybrid sensor histidine kinase/response regulator [Vibrio rotiferianus]|uniref:hybrid sensor histidine kinase/response regulator n=1 Tax=Vibrio rotiferianus TaxID=190895 RepID=UPI0014868FED|nr:ATP-binding protein [Vibrio rotiferianus]
MTKLSIKSRLALLTMMPIVVITWFALLQFSHTTQQVERLNLTVNNIHTLKTISDAANFVYRSVRERQHQKTDVLSVELELHQQEVQQFYNQFARNPNTRDFALEWKEEALNVFSSPLDEVVESGDIAYQMMTLMLKSVNREYHQLESDESQWTQDIIAHLAELSFWTQKEAWLTYTLAISGHTQPNRDKLMMVVDKQQDSLDSFLLLGADSQQVAKLLDFFQSTRYQQNVQRRAILVEGKMSQVELQSYLVDLDYRLQRLLQLIKGFSIQAEERLMSAVEDEKRELVIINVTVFLVVALLCFLGGATWFRVRSKLGAILYALSGRDEKDSSSSKITVDGSDEFTEFAKQVNKIIEEQRLRTGELVKTRESAIAANRAKSVFLANMSHEIRTPLNGIIGMTEILSHSALDSQQQEVLDNIDTSSHSLLILLNDILDLSKIESGNLNLSLTEADIREVIYQSLILFHSKATSKSIELHVNLDESIPALVKADDHRIKQIITNLLSNAIKFTDDGYISVDVGYQRKSASKGALHFKVTDTGIGIDESQLSNIFKPFTQEDDSITRQFGGTGLGLAICRQLVSMMGGELKAQSTKGYGSSFEFSIEVEIVSRQLWRSQVVKRGLLISDNYRYSPQLERECRLAGIVLTGVDDAKDACGLKGEFDVVFYCYSLHQNINKDLEQLEARFPLEKVVVCQHHLFSTHISLDRVHALLTQPFLGKRFQAAISELAEIQLRKSQSLAEIAVNAQPLDQYVAGKHKRILIAEDNLMNQKIASFFLEKAGYDYLITSNGKEALDAITQGGEFDAILMDCMMPVMDGLTATEEIRRWEDKTKKHKTTIIALTASVLEEDIQKCFSAGMDAYLPKPYKSHQLFELFKELKLA